MPNNNLLAALAAMGNLVVVPVGTAPAKRGAPLGIPPIDATMGALEEVQGRRADQAADPRADPTAQGA